jgi:CheY-like chemotaxis protein
MPHVAQEEHKNNVEKILVVDDESMIVRLLRNSLREMLVEGFERPEEALERVSSEAFDVVFCDLIMPGMTGVEFYEELLTRNRAPRTFVLMTGFAVDQDLQAYVEGHGISLLRKPFRLTELLELVPRSASSTGGSAKR